MKKTIKTAFNRAVWQSKNPAFSVYSSCLVSRVGHFEVVGDIFIVKVLDEL